MCLDLKINNVDVSVLSLNDLWHETSFLYSISAKSFFRKVSISVECRRESAINVEYRGFFCRKAVLQRSKDIIACFSDTVRKRTQVKTEAMNSSKQASFCCLFQCIGFTTRWPMKEKIS